MNDPAEGLSLPEIVALVRGIARGNGVIAYTNHADERMQERELSTLDCEHALRAGVIEETDADARGRCFRARTHRMELVFRASSRVKVTFAYRTEGLSRP